MHVPTDIELFEDPNKCANYIESHRLNQFRSVNPYVVEVLGNQFTASLLTDCWDREHVYFEIIYKHGQRVLEGGAPHSRHLTLIVNNN